MRSRWALTMSTGDTVRLRISGTNSAAERKHNSLLSTAVPPSNIAPELPIPRYYILLLTGMKMSSAVGRGSDKLCRPEQFVRRSHENISQGGPSVNPGMQRSTMAASLFTHQVSAPSNPSALPSAGDCEAASSSQASAERYQLALMRAGQLSAV